MAEEPMDPKKGPLTGQAALDFFELVTRKHQEQRAEELAQARADAVRRGKEPFDLAKLETMCSTMTAEGNLPSLEERLAYHEYNYYVVWPKIMTLAEYAEHIERVSLW